MGGLKRVKDGTNASIIYDPGNLLIEQFCAQGTQGDQTVEIRITVNSERQISNRTGGKGWNKLTEEILLKPKLCHQVSRTCILNYYCLRFF